MYVLHCKQICWEIFEKRGHKVDNLKTMSQSELCKIIDKYDALVVRSATKVTSEVLEAATKMRVVGRAGVGVDNIDITSGHQARHHGYEHTHGKYCIYRTISNVPPM